MKTYTVTLTHSYTAIFEIPIKADSEQQAKELALEHEYIKEGFNWEDYHGHAEVSEVSVCQYLIGDRVYWNDPDDGKTSGYYHIKEHLSDGLILIGNFDQDVKVHINELR